MKATDNEVSRKRRRKDGFIEAYTQENAQMVDGPERSNPNPLMFFRNGVDKKFVVGRKEEAERYGEPGKKDDN